MAHLLGICIIYAYMSRVDDPFSTVLLSGLSHPRFDVLGDEAALVTVPLQVSAPLFPVDILFSLW